MNPQSMHEMSYYPGFERWWKSVDGVMRAWAGPRPRRRRGDAAAARARADQVDGQGGRRRLLRAARVDDGRHRLLDVHVDQRLHHEGDRAVPGPHVPRVQRRPDPAPRRRSTRSGSSSTWSRTRNAKLCKVYAPEDGPLNDPRMWPFYEKACELDIPLTIHTGMAYVLPAAEQVHASRPARRRAARLPRPEDHRLPHGLAVPRGADRPRRQAPRTSTSASRASSAGSRARRTGATT